MQGNKKEYKKRILISTFSLSWFVLVRDVHGLGWVWLRGFFDPTHHGGSKKIQPNPTQPNPHGLG